jgi:hypothetical protein
VFDYYMAQVFEVTLMSHIQENWLLIWEVCVGEIVVIILLLTMVSYFFVSKLHKKLR